jgi:synaptic vesicle membrane protein VAT-1
VRAVWITRHGPPEVLEVREAPDPEPGPGEVRVRVAAAGLNFADLSARVGLYPDAPKPPCVVGYEVAGRVDAVGEGVVGLSVGARVVAMTRFGGHADTVCVPEGQAARMPESMSWEEGAGLLVTYLTAHHMLFGTGTVREGSSVLVHMAAGGVGLATLQLLSLVRGVTIFGTASPGKHALLRELGVAHPIDYRSLDYAAEVRRLTEGRGVDLVLDALGGKDWRKGYELLKPGGRLVAFGFANAVGGQRRNWLKVLAEAVRIPRFSPLALMDKNRTVAGVNLGHLWEEFDLLVPQIDALLRHYESGVVRPRIDARFPLEEAAEAHRYIHDRKNQGKVVLTTGLEV